MMTGVHGLDLHEYEVEHFLMNRKLYQSEKMLAIFRFLKRNLGNISKESKTCKNRNLPLYQWSMSC